MSVYKILELPNKAMSLAVAKLSSEGDISLSTDDGLYVLKLRVLADKATAGLIVHMARVAPITEVFEFDVGIKHEALQREIQDSGEIHGDFLEVMLNRTLSPQIDSLQANHGFVMSLWSPDGADMVGRPVIAGLTGDHRLDIISRKGSEKTWKRVVSIAEMYQKVMKDRAFKPATDRCVLHKTGEMEAITKLKQRTYLLAAVALAWSPAFTETNAWSKSTEPPTKMVKLEGVKNKPCRFSYLVQASKSGHLSLWKVRFPVSSKDDVSFVDVIDVHKEHPSVICWCGVQSGPGVLAVGYNNGVLKILPLCWAGESLGTGEVLTLFDDVDQIRINTFGWDDSRSILYVGKGAFFFAFSLKIDSRRPLVKVCQQTHLPLSPKLSVNEIFLMKNVISVSTSDDVLTLFKCTKNKGLTLTKVSSIKTPHPITNPLKPWRNHGLIWTRNEVFSVIISSPGWNYCHLDIRKPLKVHFVSQKTVEDVVASLLVAQPDAFLYDYIDCLAYLKQICYNHEDLIPPPLVTLVQEKTKWHTLSYFQTKLLRYILKFQIFHKKAEVVKKIEEEILYVEELIRTYWLTGIMRRVAGDVHNSITSSKQILSLSLMCEWTLKKGSEEDKKLVQEIKKKYPIGVNEICEVCGEIVVLTSLSKDACSNGHYFGRCSHSLLLCQEIPYRVCEECGALATVKETQAVPLPEAVYEDTCPICDYKLMLP